MDHVGSFYSPGENTSNQLTLNFTLAPPPASVHVFQSLLEFKIGASTGAGDAGGQTGFKKSCGRTNECRLTYTVEEDSRGQVLSDAFVLFFWAEAAWETDQGVLGQLIAAPQEDTFSAAISLRNPLMVGKDPRKDDTAHFLGSPNANYRLADGRISVSIDGLVLPSSRIADHYQTQVSNSVEFVTHEANSGNAQYVVPFPEEQSGLGYVSVRSRARVCAGATERTFMVDDGDPDTGDAYTVQPYHCIYSFWGVPWTPPIPIIEAGAQPAGAALMGTNDPHPRVVGAVEEILNAVMPVAEDRERPGMEDWLVLFCLIAALVCAIGFGLAGGAADSMPTAVASGGFAFSLVFGLLGTRLFGIENGMAFAVCIIPIVASGLFFKARFL